MERPTFGEELFDERGLDDDDGAVGFVPPAVTPPLRVVTGGLSSHPSGVVLSDQLLFPPLPAGTLVAEDEVGTFLACLRKPKLILGILLPNPPPLLDLFESDIVSSVLIVLLLLFVFVRRGEEEVEREGQLVECFTLGSKGRPRKEMSFKPELL